MDISHLCQLPSYEIFSAHSHCAVSAQQYARMAYYFNRYMRQVDDDIYNSLLRQVGEEHVLKEYIIVAVRLSIYAALTMEE